MKRKGRRSGGKREAGKAERESFLIRSPPLVFGGVRIKAFPTTELLGTIPLLSQLRDFQKEPFHDDQDSFPLWGHSNLDTSSQPGRKMTETVEVGCAIIHRNGKLLIAQRHLNDSFGGYWEFPGGRREPNETIEACLVREASEELGIRIRPERLLCGRVLGPNPSQWKHGGPHTDPLPQSGHGDRPNYHSGKEIKSLGGASERRISLFFFFCKWESGEPRAIDCKDFRWVSREDIRQYTLLPGDLEVLEDLILHWDEYFKTDGIRR